MPVIEANGNTLAYVDEGTGPVLLLIHSEGANSYMWREQIAALRGRTRCIAFDCPGHGDSSGNGDFSLAEVAATLKAGLDALGVEQCHILGLAMGSLIAIEIAARWPGQVRSLILAGASARPRDGAEDEIYAIREAVAYMSMKEYGGQYSGNLLMPTTSFDQLDELADAVAKVASKAYVATVRAVLTNDCTDALAEIKAPTLVVIGDEDDVTPMAEAELIAGRIEGAKIQTIAGAGHLANIDQPASFNAAVAQFLEGQGAG